MLTKLIAAGVIALLLIAAAGSFIHGQRQIGVEQERAKLLEQQKAAAEDIARANQEGKLYALKKVAELEKRSKAADALAATGEKERQLASDAQAKKDAAWAAYRSELVHPYGVSELRTATLLAAHDEASRNLSRGTAIPPASSIPGDPGAPDKRLVDRIRAAIGRPNP